MTIERSIPAGVIRELGRQESGEEYLVFLTISHRTLLDPIRVVTDPVDFILDGSLHYGFKFDIKLLSDSDDMPFAQISLQNVDQRIGRALQDVFEPARLDVQVIALSEFDLELRPREETDPGNSARIYRARDLYLVDVECDSLMISGRIVSWDYTQEPYPGIYATQDRFPGLFR